MGRLLSWFGSRADRHLTDGQIIALLDGETPAQEATTQQEHLSSCWRCRSRREYLESTILSLMQYRESLLAPFLPPPPLGEDRFLSRLDERKVRLQRSWWTRLVPHIRFFSVPNMNPALTSLLVIALAAGTLFLIWQRNAPSVSANEFLERAAKWEAVSKSPGKPGVVYQEVRIRTPKQTFDRALYHDVEGHRHPRPEQLKKEEGRLRADLERAGVNWDEPLSPADYKDWHDALSEKKDSVVRSGYGQLTLTTTPQNGAVTQESLTVSQADFHPMLRTIQLRDSEPIEIAELNYAILDWNTVNDSIFEPLPASAALRSAAHSSILPPRPTKEELDEAELEARLVLNRLGADRSEQLEFSRSKDTVAIHGLVETDERKSAVLSKLRLIPHVSPSIFSIEELNTRRKEDSAAPEARSISEYSLVAQPSPLEEFFRTHSRTKEELSRASQEVLDATLTVQQESIALTDLLTRFAGSERMTDRASSALDELMVRHTEKLLAGLAAEGQIVDSLHLLGTPLPAGEAEAIQFPDEDLVRELSAQAVENRKLSKELITGTDASQRPATEIATDLAHSVIKLRAITERLEAQMQKSKTLRERP